MKVLLVDDHKGITEGMKEFLDRVQTITLTCEANSIKSALTLVKKHDFDVAIIDLGLQNEDGMDLIRKLENLSPKTRVIVYTNYDCKQKGLEALKCGVYGFFNKNTSLKQFPEILQNVMAGDYCFSQSMINHMANLLKNSNEVDFADQLNQSQRNVVKLMAENLTPQDIANKIDTSISNVYKIQNKIKDKWGLKDKKDIVTHWKKLIAEN